MFKAWIEFAFTSARLLKKLGGPDCPKKLIH
jgi:hypothetical protein